MIVLLLVGPAVASATNECLAEDEMVALSDTKMMTYRGCQTRTVSGRRCQKWTAQYPHEHKFTPDIYPAAGLGDHTYCRNPLQFHTIWCMTEDPNKRWEICAPIGQEAKELPKSVEDLLAEQKEKARLKEEEKEKRRKEKLRADAKRTYQVETSASSEPLDVDPPGQPGDEFTALLVATASFLSAIICTTVILCCCCGVCSGPKVGSGSPTKVTPMARNLAQVAPIGHSDDPTPEKAKQIDEGAKPKPTPRPSPRDVLNQSLNSSLNSARSIASMLTPRSPRMPYFLHVGRNPETGVARDYV
jgi:hypothetical protein